MVQSLTFVILALCSLICVIGVVSLYRRQHSVKRIIEFSGFLKGDEETGPRERRSRVRRWLSLAGFRHPSASLVFLGSMVVSTWLALGIMTAMTYFRAIENIVGSMTVLPGEIGGGLVFVGEAVPWMLFFLIGASPILFVRRVRQQLVADVERDLPLFLDLLATLAEAGMSFDLALSKILSSQPSGRPLTREFRVFQREISLGISRLKSFRRLAGRLSVPSISLFVSALIQSEQLGSNVAQTLRRQSNELRNRRREKAMLHAQGLSVKLVFPLVICFLPGIFLATLGPTIYQLVQVVGGVMGVF